MCSAIGIGADGHEMVTMVGTTPLPTTDQGEKKKVTAKQISMGDDSVDKNDKADKQDFIYSHSCSRKTEKSEAVTTLIGS